MAADLMTDREKALLQPWGDLYKRLEDHLDKLSDEELGELYGALHAPTQTNCWYAIMRAADALKPIVAAKCGERTMRKLKSMDESEPKTES